MSFEYFQYFSVRIIRFHLFIVVEIVLCDTDEVDSKFFKDQLNFVIVFRLGSLGRYKKRLVIMENLVYSQEDGI